MILAFIINWALSLNQMHLPKVTQSQDKRHFLVTPSSTTLHIVLGQIESKSCFILIWNLGLNELCLKKIHHLQKFWQFREFQTVNIFNNSTFWLKMTHSALVCSYKQEKKDYGSELLIVSIRRIRLNSRILLNKKIGVNSIYKV